VGAEFAGTLKAKTAYVLHDKTTYGQGVAEAFKKDLEKKGVKVIGFEARRRSRTSTRSSRRIKAKNPELVYFGGHLRPRRALLQAGTREGCEGEVPRPTAWTLRTSSRSAARPWWAPYYTTAARAGLQRAGQAIRAREYKKKYGKNPEPYAAESYGPPPSRSKR